MSENEVKDPQEIYQEIGSLIWSVFPEDALEAYFYCQVFDTFREYCYSWINSNGSEASPDFDDSQINEVTYLIGKQLKFLQQHPIFSQERWTHCKVTVTTEGKLNIDFAYIEESDTWTGLYMRGISSLTEEEADRYSVPEELWEERRAQ
ncbi:immunity protein YezG family protein [Salinivibrio sp. ML198]|uniref:immunity protein YezG family protein n=1 Tax=Salinivibrio sp. ML198 TaxID=1909458 RepID=UPI0013015B0F|nr:immunity protein YezG family protein [Salinivibrio sp. ML198]